MPKTKTDYSKTIIYKIVCNDLSITDLYVGSTTNFTNRKYGHKVNCNNRKDLNVYNFISSNGGWEGWDMIEIEKYPCKDNNEARARERYWYEQLNANLNMIQPYRSYEEKLIYERNYKLNNAENVKIKKNEYNIKNRQEILEHKRNHYQEVKEEQKIYREEHKDNYKKYVEDNPEKIKAIKYAYYERNKIKINETCREKRRIISNFKELPFN